MYTNVCNKAMRVGQKMNEEHAERKKGTKRQQVKECKLVEQQDISMFSVPDCSQIFFVTVYVHETSSTTAQTSAAAA